MRKIIAFYLPQFHPIPENDFWWGKGFTEWTNVGNAKPLFWGHYQPKVPADLGYYDLRIDEIAEEQSRMALEAGINGFMYWHYWFGEGKTIMDMPLKKMLSNEKIEIDFALCWANHSWFAKNWNASKTDCEDKLLIEQKYLGKNDCILHFNSVLQSFNDPRYIKINNKPLFGLYQPYSMPNVDEFIDIWNDLSKRNGFDGIYFMAFNSRTGGYEEFKKTRYDMCVVDCVADSRTSDFRNLRRLLYYVCKRLKIPQVVNYTRYVNYCVNFFKNNEDVVPCIVPNYDHTPRSGRSGLILYKSTPEKWENLLNKIKIILDKKSQNINSNFIFIKAWNEWAEGNYLEPDMKYGNRYLKAIKKVFYK